MSIPQICPNCENHISAAHAPGCCYGTAEYTHLGWPNQNMVSSVSPFVTRCGTGTLSGVGHTHDGTPVYSGGQNVLATAADSVPTHGHQVVYYFIKNDGGYLWNGDAKPMKSVWSNQLVSHGGSYTPTGSPTMEELSKDGFVDSASAIRRLLAYLQDEPEEAEPSEPAPNKFDEFINRIADRAGELRKEAAGMYNIEARAKRNFAADVLDKLCEDIAG